MKKFIKIAAFSAAMMAFGTMAFAANGTVKTTSEPITKVGCEKAGSIAITFDPLTKFDAGDHMYFDLDTPVTLCSSFDYVIAITNPAGVDFPEAANGGRSGALRIKETGSTTTTTAEIDGSSFFDAALDPDGVGAATGGQLYSTHIGTATNSPMYVILEDGAVEPALTTTVGKLAFRVVGTEGSSRINIYVVGNGASQLTVSAKTKLVINILNGKPYAYDALAAGAKTFIIPNTNGAQYVDNGVGVGSVLDDNILQAGEKVDKYYSFGEYYTARAGSTDLDERKLSGTDNVKANTQCVSAKDLPASKLYISGDSKNDDFVFSGDNQVAHVMSSSTYSLGYCPKLGLPGTIPLSSGQTATTCRFIYNDGTGYCTDFKGNRIIVQTSGTQFGSTASDLYDYRIDVLTSGVYLAGSTSLMGFSSGATYCPTTAGLAAPAGVAVQTAANGALYKSETEVATGAAPTTCTVTADYRAIMEKTSDGNLNNLFDKKYLWINLPTFAYDNSVVAAGTEVKVKVTLSKVPCGTILQETVSVGSFVTTCAAVATSTQLMYPFFPSMTGADMNDGNWAAALIVVNTSSAAGTAKLTFSDRDGKSGAFTTPSIPAGGQVVYVLGSTDATNGIDLDDIDGTFDGTKKYSVKAECTFASPAGFAFLIGPAGSGAGPYTAYTSTGGWQ